MQPTTTTEIPTYTRTSADEHPRERLLNAGPTALSDAELLSLVLRDKHGHSGDLETARQVLGRNRGLLGLNQATAEELFESSLKPQNTASVMAALELGRRLARAQLTMGRRVSKDPEIVAKYIQLRYTSQDQEILGALFLSVQSIIVDEREIFRGTLGKAVVEPRAILKHALLKSAPKILLFHTHTSNVVTPSADDIAFTKRIAEAAESIGIQLVEHLIVSPGGKWCALSRRIDW